MVRGLETMETNRRHSLSLAPVLTGRCCHCQCHDPTQHTSAETERKKNWSNTETVGRSSFGHIRKRMDFISPQQGICLAVVYAYKAPQCWSTGLQSHTHMANVFSVVMQREERRLPRVPLVPTEESQGHLVENSAT